MSDRAECRAADRPVGDVLGRSVPRAPSYESLPTAKARTTRAGAVVREVGVRIEVVTPILGGASQIRTVDDVEIIRAPTVRGHLRLWWRALYSYRFQSPEELYARESEVWGRAATDEGGRSAVDIRITVEQPTEVDRADIRLYDSKDAKATPGAYALWPARGEPKKNSPPAPRRVPGTRFRLTLAAPADLETEIRNVVRAWLLFGGYGSRTRRGLGSLTVLDDANPWLPSNATRDAMTALFGFDVFASPGKTVVDSPRLGGAALHVGTSERDATKAWATALDWLKEFRQGTSGARQPDPTGMNQRPSVSNWPEADKVRRLSTPKGALPWAHKLRHNGTPAWPRAGFGLPIIGQFQQQSRQARPGWKRGGKTPKNLYWDELPSSHPNYGTEPAGFELRWRSGRQEHDRLASPLIVKALPLADGTYVPCALWLGRAYPRNGEVGVARPKRDGRPSEKEVDPQTAAPFDRLVALGDTPRFSALADKQGLRDAFLDWLHAKRRTTVVAP